MLQSYFMRRVVETHRHLRESRIVGTAMSLSPNKWSLASLCRVSTSLILIELRCPGLVLASPQVAERDLKLSEKVSGRYRGNHRETPQGWCVRDTISLCSGRSVIVVGAREGRVHCEGRQARGLL